MEGFTIFSPEKKNCPNCAAPYDIRLNKCPYCGTSYYDLSALDLTGREPFYLKIKTEINGMPCYITQLVRLKHDVSIEVTADTTCCYEYGAESRRITSGINVSTNIEFESVQEPNKGMLFEVEL